MLVMDWLVRLKQAVEACRDAIEDGEVSTAQAVELARWAAELLRLAAVAAQMLPTSDGGDRHGADDHTVAHGDPRVGAGR